MATAREPIEQAGYISATSDIPQSLSCKPQPVHTLGQPPSWPWALLAPLLFGCVLEVYEIWDFYHDIGLRGPGRKPLHRILLHHAGDVGKVLAVPLLLVLTGLILPAS